MPLDLCSKEMVMDLSESPAHCIPLCPINACSQLYSLWAVATNGTQDTLRSGCASFSYNNKHSVKEKNCSTPFGHTQSLPGVSQPSIQFMLIFSCGLER